MNDTAVYPPMGSTTYGREMSIEHPSYTPSRPGTLCLYLFSYISTVILNLCGGDSQGLTFKLCSQKKKTLKCNWDWWKFKRKHEQWIKVLTVINVNQCCSLCSYAVIFFLAQPLVMKSFAIHDILYINAV